MIDVTAFQELRRQVEARYKSRRPQSAKLYQGAMEQMPGGDTRSTTFHRPFPTYIDGAEGFQLFDADGMSYIDFMSNFTSQIHGHAHPGIVQAVVEQISRGSAYGGPCESQSKLAAEIRRRLPSVDKVRFCNSGTEATLGAIRLARAYRRRYRVLKMEGGYHGSHDLVEISISPPLEKAGPIDQPTSVPQNAGIPPGVLNDCVIAPFNEPKITEQIIAKNHDELAAVIIEAVQGTPGMVTADREFLRRVRDVAAKYDVPFILDEVITLRLAWGGCQEIYDITPDLTTLGKIIGGGFPVGAIGGREEMMDLYSPLNPGGMSHSGTFNGNPLTMAAGLAAMQALTRSEIKRINALGEKLRADFARVFAKVGIKAQVTGMGSLSQIHITDRQVENWRAYAAESKDVGETLHLMFLDRGIWVATRNMFCISTPMGEAQVEAASAALEDSLLEMKPALMQAAPGLVTG